MLHIHFPQCQRAVPQLALSSTVAIICLCGGREYRTRLLSATHPPPDYWQGFHMCFSWAPNLEFLERVQCGTTKQLSQGTGLVTDFLKVPRRIVRFKTISSHNRRNCFWMDSFCRQKIMSPGFFSRNSLSKEVGEAGEEVLFSFSFQRKGQVCSLSRFRERLQSTQTLKSQRLLPSQSHIMPMVGLPGMSSALSWPDSW